MTCNVFGGTLNLTQSVNQSKKCTFQEKIVTETVTVTL